MKKQEHIIAADDKISLSIWNHDDLSIGSVYGIYNSNEVYGKWVLVDKDGYAALPKIGRVRMAGLTIQQATDNVRDLYKTTIVDPIITLRVLNKDVTVLGEVRSPGIYSLEKEHTTLTYILGKAGGLDYFGDARRVTVIRGNDQNKKEFIVDFTKLSTIEKDNLYVRSGDIVYIPAYKRKNFEKETPAIVPIASLLSSMAIVASLLLK
jgi:polysaccharide export outer membrane protein